MTVVLDFGTGKVKVTCNTCGVPVLGFIRCYCMHGQDREWCEEHVCSCGMYVDSVTGEPETQETAP